jgi:acetyl esterase/lipase
MQSPLPNFGIHRDRELLKETTPFCYKESPSGPLQAHVFFPPTPRPEERPPMLVFFHGGFWDLSAVTHFATQCVHFAERGCLCVAAETRVSSRHPASTPMDALEDAQDLIIALKQKAEEWHFDPQKIVLVGAAGGAFLALHAAMEKKPRSVDGIDPRPAALILLSALVDTGPKTDQARRFASPQQAKALSPLRMTRRKLPPMLFLHGQNDRITPISAVKSLCRWLRFKGNKALLISYKGADHRFFNFNADLVHYDLCLREMESFLRRYELNPAHQTPQALAWEHHDSVASEV